MKQKKVTKLTLNKLTVANLEDIKGGVDRKSETCLCIPTVTVNPAC